MERLQLNKGEVVNLMDETRGGIHKIMYYVMGSAELAFITVQDDKGPDFAIDIPPKADMPEGRTPLWYWNHAMLFGPEQ
jgi:hypothetical protein